MQSGAIRYDNGLKLVPKHDDLAYLARYAVAAVFKTKLTPNSPLTPSIATEGDARQRYTLVEKLHIGGFG